MAKYQLICCCCCFFAIADESCTKFYVPDKNSPLTLGVCDGGSCKCVNGKLEQLLTLLSYFDPAIVNKYTELFSLYSGTLILRTSV